MNRFLQTHPVIAVFAFAALVVVGPWLAIWLSRNDDGDDSP